MFVHRELVPKSTVEVVPWEAYKENPRLHPQRESYRCHKRIRECRTHSTMREAKKKKSGKSIKVLWHSTSYLKPVISGSNMAEFTPNLVISFLA